MCSARSFGSASSFASSSRSSFAPPARKRSRDRAVEGVASLNLHQHLRRTPHDGNVVEPQKINIRRGIHHAQRAINIKRIGADFRLESLAGDNLENIARADVGLRLAHPREIPCLGDIRTDLERARASFFLLSGGNGCSSFLRVRRISRHRRFIFLAQAAFAVCKHVAHDPHAMPHVVKGNQAEVEHHDAIVEIEVVATAGGNGSSAAPCRRRNSRSRRQSAEEAPARPPDGIGR